MDWLSIDPIDNDKALIGWQQYYHATNRAGSSIAVFDGTSITNRTVIRPWLATHTTYTDTDLYGVISYSAIYLGENKIIGVLNGEEDDGTGTAPWDYYQTWAVAAELPTASSPPGNPTFTSFVGWGFPMRSQY
jgi:hypothetical protein